MNKFSSIESFSHLIKSIKYYADTLNTIIECLPPQTWTGTCKLHGTNASVRIDLEQSSISACSRNRILSGTNEDNAGWRAFVESKNPSMWVKMAQEVQRATKHNGVVTIYGEWCGEGIQDGVALTQCPKHFVIFMVAVDETYYRAPSDLAEVSESVYNIGMIPTYSLTIDFTNLQAASDTINKLTEDVQTECPWAKIMFDVSGVGEGIVWTADRDPSDTSQWFKSKGTKHAVRNNPKGDIAPISPEVVESIKEVVSIMLTENRMTQMVKDNGFEYDHKNIGPFLKAVCTDCLKEEVDLLEANNLEWKQVAKLLQHGAREWFMAKIEHSIFDGN